MIFLSHIRFLFFLSLLLFFLERLGILLYFGFFLKQAKHIPLLSLLKSFEIGFLFDLRTSLLISLLLSPILIIKKISLKSSFLSFFYCFLLGTFIADFGHFAYLESRGNASFLVLLEQSSISWKMVLQTYPIFSFCLILIFSFLFFQYLFFQRFQKKISPPFLSKKIIIGIHFIFLVIGLYGSFSAYPLRWSHAFFDEYNFSSQLALNPWHYFADTYRFRHPTYNKTMAHKYYNLVSQHLGVDAPNESSLNFLRTRGPSKDTTGSQSNPPKSPPNVVVIIMESVGYVKTGIGGNTLNPTPFLDALAKESLVFTRFFTPTLATARSVFAAITSLPDVSDNKTATRNPFLAKQHTLIRHFQEHKKFYFIGGSASWGNIRGILNNIPELNLYEEGRFSSPVVDVWGISDLDLFKEANQVFTQQKDPFFAIIQTAGFHRPYTIPKNKGDFIPYEEKDISPTLLEEQSFFSLEELNSLRFQDYSVGQFLKMAKESPYYDNTIFVLFGDHGLPQTTPKTPEWEKASGMYTTHVPLLIHYPLKLTPREESTVASEVDVMPTLAGLVGVPYQTQSLGRDLLNPQDPHKGGAFYYNWYAPHEIGFIKNNFFYMKNPISKIETFFETNSPILDTTKAKERFPQEFTQMKELTEGLFETVKYLYYHNPPLPEKHEP